MAGSIAAVGEPTVYQSLYRRYRPQRFDQVLGQDHITQALRNAVRDGRVGHAYLFSGPRGTGKTSTARILAKVLNCRAPRDGEPCGACERCQAVERGQDVDWLLEQDAASKSKVDDMRDLLDRVPLGTSGERRVIILDEVHMLSQGAENALLKTLEEPPPHVVFVLATTDPQKVRPTIRSRTQHFEFHLLSSDMMAEHIRQVIADADLALSPQAQSDAVAHVVRVGAGSVRDALSALDQVAALGEVMIDPEPVDAILDAVAAQDPGGALVAVSEAVARGREPRALGEALIVRLRHGFLTLMGAADELPASERERAKKVGDRMGAAGLTRALDVLGEALSELTRKPDPRIVLEVALVRVTRPDADRTLDSLVTRVERLERAVGAGATTDAAPPKPGGGGSGKHPVVDSGPAAPGHDDSGRGPAQARATLASRTETTPEDPGPVPPPQPRAMPQEAPEPASDAQNAGAEASIPDVDMPDLATLESAWGDSLLRALPIPVRSKWRGGRWVEVARGTARFAVPNEWHKQACDGKRGEVERALASHFGGPVGVEVVVRPPDAGASQTGHRGRDAVGSTTGGGEAMQGSEDVTSAGVHDPLDAAGDEAVDDSGVDLAEVGDLADAKDVASGGVDLLVREFGGELVSSDAPEDDR